MCRVAVINSLLHMRTFLFFFFLTRNGAEQYEVTRLSKVTLKLLD